MLYLKHAKKSLIVGLCVLTVAFGVGMISSVDVITSKLMGAPVVGTKLHVAGVGIGWTNTGGPKRLALATVHVEDEFGTRINGALVEGNWSDCFSYADSATTQTVTYSDGTVIQGVARIWANKSNSCWGQPVRCFWTFTVTNISMAGMAYDPTANANGQNSATLQCR